MYRANETMTSHTETMRTKPFNTPDMRVLSLFDGMSCGQIALKELGYDVEYYASEIDKHAITQTQLNFPDTMQLGDVTKWRECGIDWNFDLILAGSPCQGFSFAGKQLAFDDPRSKLFFVFVDILNHVRSVNPDVKFLLENVRMKAEHEAVITQFVGVNPLYINSALVSAQSRDRLYWTNIGMIQSGLFGEFYPGIPQPEDRGILLRDILEAEVDEKYYLKSENMLKFVTDQWRLDKRYTQIDGEKALPQMARQYQSWCGDYVLDGNRYRIRRLTPLECARLQTIPDWYKWKNIEINYITNNTKAIEQCNNYAKLRIVNNLLQAKKLGYATNIILDSLDTELLEQQDLSLIKQLDVKWMDVKDTAKQQSELASCTINVGSDTELLTYLQKLLNQKLSVNFAIRQLEGMVVMGCVVNTFKCGEIMETHSMLKKSETIQMPQGTLDINPERIFTEWLQNKLSVENSSKELKLSIILTLINLIITQATLLSSQKKPTQLYINSSIELQGDLLKLDLLYLEMGNIRQTSDSSIYRMLGNGWTVEVIKHILSYLN